MPFAPNIRTGPVAVAAAIVLSACAGPPDASRCAERLQVTATVPAAVDRAAGFVLLVSNVTSAAEVGVYRFVDGVEVPVPGQ